VAKSASRTSPSNRRRKKGAEVRLQFSLKPQPQFGSLQITVRCAHRVLVDQKSPAPWAGWVVRISEIQPGDHTIELRREQRLPKRLQRSFQRARLSCWRLGRRVGHRQRYIGSPAPQHRRVTYRRGDETDSHEVRGSQIELPPVPMCFRPGHRDSPNRLHAFNCRR